MGKLKHYCRICGSSDTRIYNKLHNIRKCNKCEFLFVSEKTLENIILEEYGDKWAKKHLHPTFYFNGNSFKLRHGDRIANILEYFEKYRKTNHLLDLGSSYGFFSNEANIKGWNVTGVELSPIAANFARDNFSLRIIETPLEHCSFNEGQFDIIFSSHVLEHVENIIPCLQACYTFLRKGGLFYLVAPTEFSSLSFHLHRKLNTIGPPEHINFFTEKTLSRILNSNGFKIIKVRSNFEISKFLRNNYLKSIINDIYHCENDGNDIANIGKSTSKIPISIKQGLINLFKGIINRFFKLYGVMDELTIWASKS